MTDEKIIEVLEKLTSYNDVVSYLKNYPVTIPEAICGAVKLLKQKPCTGHWIEITNQRGTVIALRCSACKKSPKHAIRSEYCPNCGVKMVEPAEEEVKR